MIGNIIPILGLCEICNWAQIVSCGILPLIFHALLSGSYVFVVTINILWFSNDQQVNDADATLLNSDSETQLFVIISWAKESLC